MRRMSSLLPTRSRPERTRRRVFFLAESLETRQLLSVAAIHPANAPVANVPALIGPAVASPVAGNLATGAANAATPAVNAPPASLPIVIELGQFTINFGNGSSVTESVFLVEGFSSTGIGATSPAPSTGFSQSPSPVMSNPTSPSNGGGNAASNVAITPLTATILAGPTAKSAPVIVIIAPQAPINLTPSTIPVTTQAILATATLEEQPLQPPVLGQGFESGQTQGGLMLKAEELLRAPTPPISIKPAAPATDYVEPYEAAPENPAPVEAAPPAIQPDAGLLESILLDPINVTDRAETTPLPAPTPRLETTTHDQGGTWSVAALVGAAAVASGGYHLVHGRSNRFNQRWLPVRRSPRARRPASSAASDRSSRRSDRRRGIGGSRESSVDSAEGLRRFRPPAAPPLLSWTRRNRGHLAATARIGRAL